MSIIEKEMKKVDETTNAINELPELIDGLVELMQTPQGWAVLVISVVILIFFVLNKNNSFIFEIFVRKEKRQQQKLDNLNNYFKNEEATDTTVAGAVREARDSFFFELATGIYTYCKEMRNALSSLRQNTSHKIGWIKIKKAKSYLELCDELVLVVRDFDKVDIFGFWFNRLVGAMFFLFAIIISLLNYLYSDRGLVGVLLGILASLFLAMFAVLAFIENQPMDYAKKIRKELDNFGKKPKGKEADD